MIFDDLRCASVFCPCRGCCHFAWRQSAATTSVICLERSGHSLKTRDLCSWHLPFSMTRWDGFKKVHEPLVAVQWADAVTPKDLTALLLSVATMLPCCMDCLLHPVADGRRLELWMTWRFQVEAVNAARRVRGIGLDGSVFAPQNKRKLYDTEIKNADIVCMCMWK